MHILVIGAAGMVGRKTARTACQDQRDRRQGDRQGDADRRRRARRRPPAPRSRASARRTTCRRRGVAERLVAKRPDLIIHLAAIVSGEAEADFEKGYRINLDGTQRLFEAIRKVGDGYKPKLVFTSSIAVFGAPFPEKIGDEFFHTPLTSYGTQKAIGELLLADYSRARLLRRRRHPPADHRRAARQAQQGGLRLLLRHHARAAVGTGGGPAGRRGCAPLGRQPALGRRLRRCMPPALDTSRSRGAAQPDHAGPVGDGRRDDRGARPRRRPEGRRPDQARADPAIVKIVAGWPRDFEPKRALALGFRSEPDMDAIIRAHVEDELGGKIGA